MGRNIVMVDITDYDVEDPEFEAVFLRNDAGAVLIFDTPKEGIEAAKEQGIDEVDIAIDDVDAIIPADDADN